MYDIFIFCKRFHETLSIVLHNFFLFLLPDTQTLTYRYLYYYTITLVNEAKSKKKNNERNRENKIIYPFGGDNNYFDNGKTTTFSPSIYLKGKNK